MEQIEFNIPYAVGTETGHIQQVIANRHFASSGSFTDACTNFFKEKYGFNHAVLTNSCTDALEMCTVLMDLKPGDEVILPSYTFVSVANALLLHGAKLVFADCKSGHPGIDEDSIEQLISPNTKAIIAVHYGGVALDIEKLCAISKRHNLILIEDAAHCFDAFYKGKPLGSFGDFATFSFHETKNVHCGEGGLLVINNEQYAHRAGIIAEKGTNRQDFNLGLVSRYEWVDVGASYKINELSAAFLFGQLQAAEAIQAKRLHIWNRYYNTLKPMADAGKFELPMLNGEGQHNAHIFYLTTNSAEERNALVTHLKAKGISAYFHYLSLHSSPYFAQTYSGPELPNTKRFSECLLRLPLHFQLTDAQVDYICSAIQSFYTTI